MRPFLALMCVAAVTVPSCIIIEAEPTNFTSVALHIPDFQSSLRFVHASVGGYPLDDAPVLVVAHRPSVVLGLRGRPAEEAIASGARLVRLADGASVPMSVRSGLYDVQGRAVPGASTTGWSFVRDEPLRTGGTSSASTSRGSSRSARTWATKSSRRAMATSSTPAFVSTPRRSG
jgi:hypothetical protein